MGFNRRDTCTDEVQITCRSRREGHGNPRKTRRIAARGRLPLRKRLIGRKSPNADGAGRRTVQHVGVRSSRSPTRRRRRVHVANRIVLPGAARTSVDEHVVHNVHRRRDRRGGRVVTTQETVARQRTRARGSSDVHGIVNAVHLACRRGEVVHDPDELGVRCLAVAKGDHVVRKKRPDTRHVADHDTDTHRRRRGRSHRRRVANVVDSVARHRTVRRIGVTQSGRSRGHGPGIRRGDRVDRVLGDGGPGRRCRVQQTLHARASARDGRVGVGSNDVMHGVRRHRCRLRNASRTRARCLNLHPTDDVCGARPCVRQVLHQVPVHGDRHDSLGEQADDLLRRAARARGCDLDAVRRRAANGVVRGCYETARELDAVDVRVVGGNRTCRRQRPNHVVRNVDAPHSGTRRVHAHNARSARPRGGERNRSRSGATANRVGCRRPDVGRSGRHGDPGQSACRRRQADPRDGVALDAVAAISTGKRDALEARRHGPGHRVGAGTRRRSKSDGVAGDRVVTAAVDLDRTVRRSRRVRTRCRLEQSVVGNRPTRIAQVGVGRNQNTVRRCAGIEEVGNVVVRDDVARVELCSRCSPDRRNPVCGKCTRRQIPDRTAIDRVVVVARHAVRRTEEHNTACRRRVDGPNPAGLDRVPGSTVDEPNGGRSRSEVSDPQLRGTRTTGATVDHDVCRPVQVDRSRRICARNRQVDRGRRRPDGHRVRRRRQRVDHEGKCLGRARVRVLQLQDHVAPQTGRPEARQGGGQGRKGSRRSNGDRAARGSTRCCLAAGRRRAHAAFGHREHFPRPVGVRRQPGGRVGGRIGRCLRDELVIDPIHRPVHGVTDFVGIGIRPVDRHRVEAHGRERKRSWSHGHVRREPVLGSRRNSVRLPVRGRCVRDRIRGRRYRRKRHRRGTETHRVTTVGRVGADTRAVHELDDPRGLPQPNLVRSRTIGCAACTRDLLVLPLDHQLAVRSGADDLVVHATVFTDPQFVPVRTDVGLIGRVGDAVAEGRRNSRDPEPHEAVGVDGKQGLANAIVPELEANRRDGRRGVVLIAGDQERRTA